MHSHKRIIHYSLLNDDIDNNFNSKLIKVYAGSHAPATIFNYNILLPLKHYFEETVILLIFKEDIKYANRAVDNT